MPNDHHINSSQKPSEFHPEYQHDVFSVVFMVEGMGFKVDSSRLTSNSTFLRAMLFDSNGLGLLEEGRSIDHPIVVQGCTKEAFAHFCGWLNHCSWHPLYAEHTQQLFNILHICHMWDIQPGIDFASKGLLIFELCAAHRLYLASRYNLVKWIPDAVRELLVTGLHDYTDEDIDHLGIKIFVIIVRAKERIATERRRFGNYVPYPRDFDAAPFCAQHDICKKVWQEKWYTVISRRIHSTTDPVSLLKLPDELELVDHRGISPGCKDFIVAWLRGCVHIQSEEILITSTITTIKGLCAAA